MSRGSRVAVEREECPSNAQTGKRLGNGLLQVLHTDCVAERLPDTAQNADFLLRLERLVGLGALTGFPEQHSGLLPQAFRAQRGRGVTQVGQRLAAQHR